MEMIIVQKRVEWKGKERDVRKGKECEEGKGKGGRERKGRKGKECEDNFRIKGCILERKFKVDKVFVYIVLQYHRYADTLIVSII